MPLHALSSPKTKTKTKKWGESPVTGTVRVHHVTTISSYKWNALENPVSGGNRGDMNNVYTDLYTYRPQWRKHNLAKSSFKLKTPIKAFFFFFWLFFFVFSLRVCLFKLTAIYIFFLSFFFFLQSFLNIVQAGKTSLCTEFYVCNCIVCSFILIIKFYFSFFSGLLLRMLGKSPQTLFVCFCLFFT